MALLPEKLVWTQEEYNQRLLQMKAMGLSPESIAYILEEVIVKESKSQTSKSVAHGTA